MTGHLQHQDQTGYPMLYDAKTDAIEARRVKIRKLMARGFTAAQMASVLGISPDLISKDIASVRKYISSQLQGSDIYALIAESLGVFKEVRESALRDMDKAETVKDRSRARQDTIRVEVEIMKCLLLAGGIGHQGRVMVNVTPVADDPIPILEQDHQKLKEIARRLAGELLMIESQTIAVNCKTGGDNRD